MVTFWMWTLLRIAETIDGHCGYEFSWAPFRLIPLSGNHSLSLYSNTLYMVWFCLCNVSFDCFLFSLSLFLGSATHHDYHHSHNIGNYGSFFIIWDTIMGTNISYRKYKVIIVKLARNRRKYIYLNYICFAKRNPNKFWNIFVFLCTRLIINVISLPKTAKKPNFRKKRIKLNHTSDSSNKSDYDFNYNKHLKKLILSIFEKKNLKR